MALLLAWRTCDQLDAIGIGRNAQQWLALFSIRVLAISLGYMIKVLKRKSQKDIMDALMVSDTRIRYDQLPGSYRPMSLLMAERGWCPAEIVRMLRTYHCTTIWYLIGLRDLMPRCKNPTINCIPKLESSLDCILRRMQECDYVPRHNTEGCSCSSIRPNTDQVSAILKEGGLPLI